MATAAATPAASTPQVATAAATPQAATAATAPMMLRMMSPADFQNRLRAAQVVPGTAMFGGVPAGLQHYVSNPAAMGNGEKELFFYIKSKQ